MELRLAQHYLGLPTESRSSRREGKAEEVRRSDQEVGQIGARPSDTPASEGTIWGLSERRSPHACESNGHIFVL